MSGLYFWWNWWVSNPRPNKESKSFLHVYLILFSRKGRKKATKPNPYLHKISHHYRRHKSAILKLIMPQD